MSSPSPTAGHSNGHRQMAEGTCMDVQLEVQRLLRLIAAERDVADASAKEAALCRREVAAAKSESAQLKLALQRAEGLRADEEAQRLDIAADRDGLAKRLASERENSACLRSQGDSLRNKVLSLDEELAYLTTGAIASATEVKGLRAKLTHAEHELGVQGELVDALRAERVAADARAATLIDDISAIGSERAALAVRVASLESRVAELEAALAVEKDGHAAAEAQRDAHALRADRAESELARMSSTLGATNDALSALQAQHSALRTELAERVTEVRTMTERAVIAAADMERLRDRLHESELMCAKANRTVEVERDARKKAESSLATAEAEADRLRGALSKTTLDLQSAGEERERVEGERAVLELERERLRRTVAVEKEQRKDLEASLAAAVATSEHLTGEVATVRRELTAVSDERENAIAERASAENEAGILRRRVHAAASAGRGSLLFGRGDVSMDGSIALGSAPSVPFGIPIITPRPSVDGGLRGSAGDIAIETPVAPFPEGSGFPGVPRRSSLVSGAPSASTTVIVTPSTPPSSLPHVVAALNGVAAAVGGADGALPVAIGPLLASVDALRAEVAPQGGAASQMADALAAAARVLQSALRASRSPSDGAVARLRAQLATATDGAATATATIRAVTASLGDALAALCEANGAGAPTPPVTGGDLASVVAAAEATAAAVAAEAAAVGAKVAAHDADTSILRALASGTRTDAGGKECDGTCDITADVAAQLPTLEPAIGALRALSAALAAVSAPSRRGAPPDASVVPERYVASDADVASSQALLLRLHTGSQTQNAVRAGAVLGEAVTADDAATDGPTASPPPQRQSPRALPPQQTVDALLAVVDALRADAAMCGGVAAPLADAVLVATRAARDAVAFARTASLTATRGAEAWAAQRAALSAERDNAVAQRVAAETRLDELLTSSVDLAPVPAGASAGSDEAPIVRLPMPPGSGKMLSIALATAMGGIPPDYAMLRAQLVSERATTTQLRCDLAVRDAALRAARAASSSAVVVHLPSQAALPATAHGGASSVSLPTAQPVGAAVVAHPGNPGTVPAPWEGPPLPDLLLAVGAVVTRCMDAAAALVRQEAERGASMDASAMLTTQAAHMSADDSATTAALQEHHHTTRAQRLQATIATLRAARERLDSVARAAHQTRRSHHGEQPSKDGHGSAAKAAGDPAAKDDIDDGKIKEAVAVEAPEQPELDMGNIAMDAIEVAIDGVGGGDAVGRPAGLSPETAALLYSGVGDSELESAEPTEAQAAFVRAVAMDVLVDALSAVGALPRIGGGALAGVLVTLGFAAAAEDVECGDQRCIDVTDMLSEEPASLQRLLGASYMSGGAVSARSAGLDTRVGRGAFVHERDLMASAIDASELRELLAAAKAATRAAEARAVAAEETLAAADTAARTALDELRADAAAAAVAAAHALATSERHRREAEESAARAAIATEFVVELLEGEAAAQLTTARDAESVAALCAAVDQMEAAFALTLTDDSTPSTGDTDGSLVVAMGGQQHADCVRILSPGQRADAYRDRLLAVSRELAALRLRAGPGAEAAATGASATSGGRGGRADFEERMLQQMASMEAVIAEYERSTGVLQSRLDAQVKIIEQLRTQASEGMNTVAEMRRLASTAARKHAAVVQQLATQAEAAADDVGGQLSAALTAAAEVNALLAAAQRALFVERTHREAAEGRGRTLAASLQAEQAAADELRAQLVEVRRIALEASTMNDVLQCRVDRLQDAASVQSHAHTTSVMLLGEFERLGDVARKQLTLSQRQVERLSRELRQLKASNVMMKEVDEVAIERGFYALVALDVPDLDQLYGLSRNATRQALAQFVEICKTSIAWHGGHVLEATRDRVVGAFLHPSDALAAGCGAMLAFHAAEWPDALVAAMKPVSIPATSEVPVEVHTWAQSLSVAPTDDSPAATHQRSVAGAVDLSRMCTSMDSVAFNMTNILLHSMRGLRARCAMTTGQVVRRQRRLVGGGVDSLDIMLDAGLAQPGVLVMSNAFVTLLSAQGSGVDTLGASPQAEGRPSHSPECARIGQCDPSTLIAPSAAADDAAAADGIARSSIDTVHRISRAPCQEPDMPPFNAASDVPITTTRLTSNPDAFVDFGIVAEPYTIKQGALSTTVTRCVPAALVARLNPNVIPATAHLVSNRRLQKVPAPIGAPITLVFTDVQNSTDLWNFAQDGMRESIRLHNSRLRDALLAHHGYEVKTEGDAFMVAFADVLDAVRWCLTAQAVLLQIEWPASILAHPMFEGDPSSEGAWRGLRVRMGIHTAATVADIFCEADPLTGRYDYFGPGVNLAARIGAQAVGGEVVISETAAVAVMAALTQSGAGALGGVDGVSSMDDMSAALSDDDEDDFLGKSPQPGAAALAALLPSRGSPAQALRASDAVPSLAPASADPPMLQHVGGVKLKGFDGARLLYRLYTTEIAGRNTEMDIKSIPSRRADIEGEDAITLDGGTLDARSAPSAPGVDDEQMVSALDAARAVWLSGALDAIAKSIGTSVADLERALASQMDSPELAEALRKRKRAKRAAAERAAAAASVVESRMMAREDEAAALSDAAAVLRAVGIVMRNLVAVSEIGDTGGPLTQRTDASAGDTESASGWPVATSTAARAALAQYFVNAAHAAAAPDVDERDPLQEAADAAAGSVAAAVGVVDLNDAMGATIFTPASAAVAAAAAAAAAVAPVTESIDANHHDGIPAPLPRVAPSASAHANVAANLGGIPSPGAAGVRTLMYASAHPDEEESDDDDDALLQQMFGGNAFTSVARAAPSTAEPGRPHSSAAAAMAAGMSPRVTTPREATLYSPDSCYGPSSVAQSPGHRRGPAVVDARAERDWASALRRHAARGGTLSGGRTAATTRDNGLESAAASSDAFAAACAVGGAPSAPSSGLSAALRVLLGALSSDHATLDAGRYSDTASGKPCEDATVVAVATVAQWDAALAHRLGRGRLLPRLLGAAAPSRVACDHVAPVYVPRAAPPQAHAETEGAALGANTAGHASAAATGIISPVVGVGHDIFGSEALLDEPYAPPVHDGTYAHLDAPRPSGTTAGDADVDASGRDSLLPPMLRVRYTENNVVDEVPQYHHQLHPTDGDTSDPIAQTDADNEPLLSVAAAVVAIISLRDSIRAAHAAGCSQTAQLRAAHAANAAAQLRSARAERATHAAMQRARDAERDLAEIRETCRLREEGIRLQLAAREEDLREHGIVRTAQHSGLLGRVREGLAAPIEGAASAPPSTYVHAHGVDAARACGPAGDLGVPDASLLDCLHRICLTRPHEYALCHTCLRYTSDLLPDHYRREHPSIDVAGVEVGPPEHPTMADIIRLAGDFVRRANVVWPASVSLPIHIYTMETELYRDMNAALRSKDAAGLLRFAGYRYFLEGALKQLPSHEGYVFRGIDVRLPYVRGGLITWPSFSSASQSARVVLDGFLSGDAPCGEGTLFVMKSLTARAVSDFSALPHEREVLFMPGTQFRVLGEVEAGIKELMQSILQRDLRGVAVYEMTEVSTATYGGLRDALSRDERILCGEVDRYLHKLESTPIEGPPPVRDDDYFSVVHIAARCRGSKSILQVLAGVPIIRDTFADTIGCGVALSEEVRAHHPHFAQNAVHLAAAHPANDDAVTFLIDCDVPFDAADLRGTRPLMLAAGTRDAIATVELLVGKGADALATDHRGRSALHYAAAQVGGGSAEVAMLLLAKGLDPTVQDRSGANCFHVAASTPLSLALLQALGAGVAPDALAAAVSVADGDGHTPLARACALPHHEAVVRWLVAAGAAVVPSLPGGRTLLHIAAATHGSDATVQQLIDAGVPVAARDAGGETALLVAARTPNNAATVTTLLNNGATADISDPRTGADIAFVAAKANGNGAALRALVASAASMRTLDPLHTDPHGNTLLHFVAADRSVDPATVRDVVLALPGASRDMLRMHNLRGYAPLHIAVRTSAAVVEELLAHGADANDLTGAQEAALHLAVPVADGGATVRALVRYGADPHARDACGRSAVELATQAGDAAVMDALLVSVGVNDVDTVTGLGPIHWAVSDRRGGVMKLRSLLARGADVNLRDRDGATPLHHAAATVRNAAVVAELVRAGCDVGALAAGGVAAVHVAATVPNNSDTMEAVGLVSDASVVDAVGLTAAHRAAAVDDDGATLAALLRVAATSVLRAVGPQGESVMHVAVQATNAVTKVAVLVAAGASLFAQDAMGRTPVHVAAGLPAGSAVEAVLSTLMSGGDDMGELAALRDADGRLCLEVPSSVVDITPAEAERRVAVMESRILSDSTSRVRAVARTLVRECDAIEAHTAGRVRSAASWLTRERCALVTAHVAHLAERALRGEGGGAAATAVCVVLRPPTVAEHASGACWGAVRVHAHASGCVVCVPSGDRRELRFPADIGVVIRAHDALSGTAGLFDTAALLPDVPTCGTDGKAPTAEVPTNPAHAPSACLCGIATTPTAEPVPVDRPDRAASIASHPLHAAARHGADLAVVVHGARHSGRSTALTAPRGVVATVSDALLRARDAAGSQSGRVVLQIAGLDGAAVDVLAALPHVLHASSQQQQQHHQQQQAYVGGVHRQDVAATHDLLGVACATVATLRLTAVVVRTVADAVGIVGRALGAIRAPLDARARAAANRAGLHTGTPLVVLLTRVDVPECDKATAHAVPVPIQRCAIALLTAADGQGPACGPAVVPTPIAATVASRPKAPRTRTGTAGGLPAAASVASHATTSPPTHVHGIGAANTHSTALHGTTPAAAAAPVAQSALSTTLVAFANGERPRGVGALASVIAATLSTPRARLYIIGCIAPTAAKAEAALATLRFVSTVKRPALYDSLIATHWPPYALDKCVPPAVAATQALLTLASDTCVSNDAVIEAIHSLMPATLPLAPVTATTTLLPAALMAPTLVLEAIGTATSVAPATAAPPVATVSGTGTVAAVPYTLSPAALAANAPTPTDALVECVLRSAALATTSYPQFAGVVRAARAAQAELHGAPTPPRRVDAALRGALLRVHWAAAVIHCLGAIARDVDTLRAAAARGPGDGPAAPAAPQLPGSAVGAFLPGSSYDSPSPPPPPVAQRRVRAASLPLASVVLTGIPCGPVTDTATAIPTHSDEVVSQGTSARAQLQQQQPQQAQQQQQRAAVPHLPPRTRRGTAGAVPSATASVASLPFLDTPDAAHAAIAAAIAGGDQHGPAAAAARVRQHRVASAHALAEALRAVGATPSDRRVRRASLSPTRAALRATKARGTSAYHAIAGHGAGDSTSTGGHASHHRADRGAAQTLMQAVPPFRHDRTALSGGTPSPRARHAGGGRTTRDRVHMTGSRLRVPARSAQRSAGGVQTTQDPRGVFAATHGSESQHALTVADSHVTAYGQVLVAVPTLGDGSVGDAAHAVRLWSDGVAAAGGTDGCDGGDGSPDPNGYLYGAAGDTAVADDHSGDSGDGDGFVLDGTGGFRYARGPSESVSERLAYDHQGAMERDTAGAPATHYELEAHRAADPADRGAHPPEPVGADTFASPMSAGSPNGTVVGWTGY